MNPCMPIYEYVCPACHTRFEEVRLMKEADDPSPCPRCDIQAQRQISRFAMKRAAPSASNEQRTRPLAHSSGCPCCTPGRW
ncbi:MAG TPA: zinc ribbon domain-containing protein [Ktedonobacteraceae bacterium]|nr:zinc ribbon domain-containing protein [Ktedonobacteraceae bacterium]